MLPPLDLTCRLETHLVSPYDTLIRLYDFERGDSGDYHVFEHMKQLPACDL